MDHTVPGMDDSDILARTIAAVDGLGAIPIEFAATDLGPTLATPPRPLLEVYLLRAGPWRFRCRRLETGADAGDAIIANAHFGNEAWSQDPTGRYACVSLAIDGIPSLRDLGSAPILYRRSLRPALRDAVWSAAQGVEQALRLDRAAFAPSRRKAAYLQLLIGLSDAIGTVGMDGIGPAGAPEQIMAWIARQAMHRPLDLSPLLAELAVSERHCNRIFAAAFGRTPRQQHLRLRLERARALLQRGQGPIKAVAAAVGFSDPLYFSRQFTRAFGLAPSRVSPA